MNNMNTLRTTESSIFRLALRDVTKSKSKAGEGMSKNKSRKISSCTKQPATYSKATSKAILSRPVKPRSDYFNSKARLLSCDKNQNLISTRNLTTIEVKREFKPLINPSKPHPDERIEIPLTPIVPLTKPSFGKGGNKDAIPSVTRILQATMPASSRFLLDRWKENMIKKLGVAGFAKQTQETFARGTALHHILATYLMNKIEPSPENSAENIKEIVINLWQSIEHVVRDKLTNVRLIEHITTHSELKYRGIVDCVAYIDNELVVIDFKTAEKPKPTKDSLYDNPLQITAYCGALNSDPHIPEMAIDRNICSGLIITAYTDGSPATMHKFSRDEINSYWNQWIERLDQYSRLQSMTQQIQSKTKQ